MTQYPDRQDAHLYNHRVLSRVELDSLLAEYAALAAKHGPKSRQALAARNRVAESNLKLVAHVAKRYRVPHGMDAADVRSFGVAGLLRAVETFDLARGCQFSTHASWQIRAAIGRSLQDLAHTIRIPVHMQERSRVAVEGIAEVQAARRVLSLNAKVGGQHGDGNQTMADIVASNADDAPDVGAAMAADQDAARVRAALACLPPRLRSVVELRYLGEDTRTLPEVGEAMGGLSRERVRQLEAEAFNIMRKELGAS